MKQFIRPIVMLLLSTGLMHGACAQAITGKGFLPDENGTNLDDPQASKAAQRQKVAPGTIIKDCADCPEMVVLPSGSFLMGSLPDPVADPFSNERPKTIGEPNEKPQHRVQIQSFAIGKYEVTQEQWYAIMGGNPSENKGRTLPLENISWDDAQQFIAKLNQKTGQKYRLPSESEWEYAARAGTNTDWSFGDEVSKLGEYAWHEGNSGGNTQVVGQKLPNAFGLFDMHGNVWEWTQDCWHEDYVGAPTDGSAWTIGCTEKSRMIRGGSFFSDSPNNLRSAQRNLVDSAYRNYDIGGIGVRLVRDFSASAPATFLAAEKPVTVSPTSAPNLGAGPASKNKGAPALKRKSPGSLQFEYSYLQLDKDFLVKLMSSTRVMSVQIAIMTRYDDRVFENVKKHEMILRGVMLDIMRMTTDTDLTKPDFRKNLATKLRYAMNVVLEKYENFGGIEELIFTGFIVQ